MLLESWEAIKKEGPVGFLQLVDDVAKRHTSNFSSLEHAISWEKWKKM